MSKSIKINSTMTYHIGVIGLGYVGLQVAVALGEKYLTTGFDLNKQKITEYREGIDVAGEVSSEMFAKSTQLEFANDMSELSKVDVFIVAVPTPVDDSKRPDLSPLVSASKAVGQVMKKGAIVVFESTVFPGATEEVCVPVLEEFSSLKWQTDFYVGYSPERINPGDKAHTLQTITKVVAGDNPETLAILSEIYGSVVDAGIHQASSIKVAEAAKVIENTQRDLNIAFVNELALVFDRLGIDTNEVLDAACTKWNFLNFRPGLVGGHCIGVDPYYLTAKAQEVGYSPEVILAGRRINDSMGSYIANATVKKLLSSDVDVSCKDIIVCGLTFKENCPDLRNSLVINIIDELSAFGYNVHVHDPVPSVDEAEHEYDISLKSWDELPNSAALVCAVPHQEFVDKPVSIYAQKITQGGLFVDIKSIFNQADIEAIGLQYWSL